MAQKRMIDKKISVSEQIANLSIKGQLLFTWMIPHADDIGLLPFSNRTIKAMVIPMIDEITSEDVGALMDEMRGQKLIDELTHEGEKYWKIMNFTNFQILKRDRQPNVLIKIQFKKNPKDTWKYLENIGFQVEDSDSQLDTEEKGREGKRSKVVSSEKSDAFDQFWKAYPKKELKKKAFEIWKRKKLDPMLPEILIFIEKAKLTDRWNKGYVKQPTAFLNGECWNDDLKSYGDRAAPPSGPEIRNFDRVLPDITPEQAERNRKAMEKARKSLKKKMVITR